MSTDRHQNLTGKNKGRQEEIETVNRVRLKQASQKLQELFIDFIATPI